MRPLLVGCLVLLTGRSGPALAQAPKAPTESAPDSKVEDNRKVFFPNMLPNNITPLDPVMLEKVNSLGTKRTQVEFLVSLLPAKDAKEKLLTDDQLTAINLLGVSNSDDAVAPLLDVLEFKHKRSGLPTIHALEHLGKRSSEPLVRELGTKDSGRLNWVAHALRDVHGEKFPQFVEELKQRKDLKLSPEAIKLLEEQIIVQRAIRD